MISTLSPIARPATKADWDLEMRAGSSGFILLVSIFEDDLVVRSTEGNGTIF